MVLKQSLTQQKNCFQSATQNEIKSYIGYVVGMWLHKECILKKKKIKKLKNNRVYSPQLLIGKYMYVYSVEHSLMHAGMSRENSW